MSKKRKKIWFWIYAILAPVIGVFAAYLVLGLHAYVYFGFWLGFIVSLILGICTVKFKRLTALFMASSYIILSFLHLLSVFYVDWKQADISFLLYFVFIFAFRAIDLRHELAEDHDH